MTNETNKAMKENIETYFDLNIHQRINAKANSLVHYRHFSLRYTVSRHPDLFGFRSMLLERPGIHNNRNYDGPRDPYSVPDAAERAYQTQQSYQLK